MVSYSPVCCFVAGGIVRRSIRIFALVICFHSLQTLGVIMTAIRSSILICLFTVAVLCPAFSQQPNAVALASSALRTLTGGTAIADVTLNTTVNWFEGSAVTGTMVLEARGTSQSRTEISAGASRRTQVRNFDSDGAASGIWFGSDGVKHPIAFHNCWTEASWFFPALGALASASQPNITVTYVGHETRYGSSVEHLRFWQTVRTARPAEKALIQKLSTIDLYLDSVLLVPLGLTFNSHPDNDASLDLPTEIRFADYRVVNGVRLPFRIQKLLNGGLLLDVTVQSATFNSGLTDTLFALQ